MKIKTLATALVISIIPMAGFAAGCNYGKEQSANQCGPNQIWDGGTQACVPLTSS